LSKVDYFRECKTMLTSEKAALAKCSRIYDDFMKLKELGSKSKFMDKDFGPQRASDLERCKYTMYKTGEIPRKGYPDPRETEFAWAEDICAHKGKKP
jgi:hypothetical protein